MLGNTCLKGTIYDVGRLNSEVQIHPAMFGTEHYFWGTTIEMDFSLV
jgi:hypothetical protein